MGVASTAPLVAVISPLKKPRIATIGAASSYTGVAAQPEEAARVASLRGWLHIPKFGAEIAHSEVS
jgi:hypothetical protein